MVTRRSRKSPIVAGSAWEQHAANRAETCKLVTAQVRNNHLGFQMSYLWNGAPRQFIPDFLMRLTIGKTLMLEIKDSTFRESASSFAPADRARGHLQGPRRFYRNGGHRIRALGRGLIGSDMAAALLRTYCQSLVPGSSRVRSTKFHIGSLPDFGSCRTYRLE